MANSTTETKREGSLHDVYVLFYLGKPVVAHESRQRADEELSTYTAAEQTVMSVIPVRFEHDGKTDSALKPSSALKPPDA